MLCHVGSITAGGTNTYTVLILAFLDWCIFALNKGLYFQAYLREVSPVSGETCFVGSHIYLLLVRVIHFHIRGTDVWYMSLFSCCVCVIMVIQLCRLHDAVAVDTEYKT